MITKDIAPSKLYKYQPCSNYAFDNLKKGQLWFSKPESFNDPFDCNLNFDIVDTDKEENLQLLFSRLLDFVPDKTVFISRYTTDGIVNDSFRADAIKWAKNATTSVVARKQFGISCFAESNVNMLKWSHYANSHRGFCLEFDTRFEPFKPVKIQTLLKVDYSEKYLLLSINDIPNNLPSIPRTIYGIKSTSWRYEQEWRMFASPGDRSYPFDPLALTGIYLGCKMDETHKHEITKLLHDFPSIKLYEVQRSESEFKVYSREIFLF